MRPRQAGVAEGGGLEAGVVVSKAGGALPLGEDSADDALPRRSLDDVRHVQQLAGQDSIVHLELSAKPGHLKNEDWRRLSQFDSAGVEALVKEVLHTGQRQFGVVFDEELIVMSSLAGGELQERLSLHHLGEK